MWWKYGVFYSDRKNCASAEQAVAAAVIDRKNARTSARTPGEAKRGAPQAPRTMPSGQLWLGRQLGGPEPLTGRTATWRARASHRQDSNVESLAPAGRRQPSFYRAAGKRVGELADKAHDTIPVGGIFGQGAHDMGHTCRNPTVPAPWHPCGRSGRPRHPSDGRIAPSRASKAARASLPPVGRPRRARPAAANAGGGVYIRSIQNSLVLIGW